MSASGNAPSLDTDRPVRSAGKSMGALLVGECCEELREMIGSASVQTCITSPPYFRQRTYTADPRELGREQTVDDYVGHLVEVFREVRRVLRDDGTLWLNLDDSYPAGQLVGAPWRVALALQADGWRLRCDVIWEKPNALPSSVRSRPTRSHEYVFLLSKSADYYYDGDAIREPWTGTRPSDHSRARAKHPGYKGKHATGSQAAGFKGAPKGDPDKGRNKRSVWTYSAPRFAGQHFATMAPRVAETCILAGSRIGDTVLDPFAGAGTSLAVAQRLGRRWLGVELNPEYEPMIRERLAGTIAGRGRGSATMGPDDERDDTEPDETKPGVDPEILEAIASDLEALEGVAKNLGAGLRELVTRLRAQTHRPP